MHVLQLIPYLARFARRHTLAFTLTTSYDTLYYTCYTLIEQDLAQLLVGHQVKALIRHNRLWRRSHAEASFSSEY